MDSHRLAVELFLARGVPAADADQLAREMVGFLKALAREAQRQERQAQAEQAQANRKGRGSVANTRPAPIDRPITDSRNTPESH